MSKDITKIYTSAIYYDLLMDRGGEKKGTSGRKGKIETINERSATVFLLFEM